jgi:N-acetylmuramoyl-L-alanine amidase
MRRNSSRSVLGTTSRYTLWATLACSLLLPISATATSVARKKHLALDDYHKAVAMREALNGRPENERASDDYERAIEAFRKVYHLAPTSTRADASVLAVGDLLTEQARLNDDEKGFKSAIGQYEFLCREYPGSRYRFGALLSIAQIYREDLGDADAAKAAYEDFLKRYPNHSLAGDAKAALNEMEQEATRNDKESVKSQKGQPQAASLTKSKDLQENAGPEHHKSLAHVTSVRFWSTPDYTRIAIDLESEVKYEAGRVPSPDRIFFDLYDSRLASELIGKSYDIDDGFLKKIRVAQYKANMTRIVLEVDGLAEYSAFLLPNPYRLIIDVHGRKQALPVETATSSNPRNEGHSNSDTGVPQSGNSKHSEAQSYSASLEATTDRKAATTNSEASVKRTPLPPRPEVPLQSRDLDFSEIAAISDNPQQVKATTKPTSGPVVQNVAGAETPKPSKADSKIESSHSRNGKAAQKSAVAVASSSHEAAPTADGDLSLIRALGLKVGRIVVDAGHGGHDTGTIGPNGLMEKDLVLDVALRLGKLLEQKLGAEVVYTRHDDTFIPLETRTAIANQNQADLFISIHANSSHDPSARGVETYYLNFTHSADALEVAARENAVSETSVHDLQDLVKKIALKEKIEESREFAANVEKSLYAGEASKNPGIKDRGVKKAPFIVLIGANMPSILAEISFVSNPTDERKLRTPEYRQRIAESLYRGVARYAQGLSGVRVASAKPTVTAGQ